MYVKKSLPASSRTAPLAARRMRRFPSLFCFYTPFYKYTQITE